MATKKHAGATMLDSQIAKQGSQKIRCREIWNFTAGDATHKLRITIASDSYRDQSSAEAERWNGEEWKKIETLATGELKTQIGLSNYPDKSWNSRHLFAADIAELLRRARLILEA